jgi:hypothetical protein
MKEETPEEAEKPAISRKRKITVLIFVIGFWIFFYWYTSSQTPSPPTETPPEVLKQTRPENP